MKKAKIFLTALTVLALVGGALAFKVTVPKKYAECNLTSRKCELNTITTFSIITTNAGGGLAPYDVLGNPCVTDPISGALTCTTLTTTDPFE